MKAAELRQEPEAELRAKGKKLREEIFNLRFKATTEPVVNPAKIREMRKEIARIETILREKQLAAAPRPKKLSRAARKLAAIRRANAAAAALRRERRKALAASTAAKRAAQRGKGKAAKAASKKQG
jgi:large subunit ribosomal protein L29